MHAINRYRATGRGCSLRGLPDRAELGGFQKRAQIFPLVRGSAHVPPKAVFYPGAAPEAADRCPFRAVIVLGPGTGMGNFLSSLASGSVPGPYRMSRVP